MKESCDCTGIPQIDYKFADEKLYQKRNYEAIFRCSRLWHENKMHKFEALQEEFK